jgi:hypothetical protein
MKKALPILVLSLAIAGVLIVMALIKKERNPIKVYSITSDESSNEQREPGDYVVKY